MPRQLSKKTPNRRGKRVVPIEKVELEIATPPVTRARSEKTQDVLLIEDIPENQRHKKVRQTKMKKEKSGEEENEDEIQVKESREGDGEAEEESTSSPLTRARSKETNILPLAEGFPSNKRRRKVAPMKAGKEDIELEKDSSTPTLNLADRTKKIVPVVEKDDHGHQCGSRALQQHQEEEGSSEDDNNTTPPPKRRKRNEDTFLAESKTQHEQKEIIKDFPDIQEEVEGVSVASKALAKSKRPLLNQARTYSARVGEGNDMLNMEDVDGKQEVYEVGSEGEEKTGQEEGVEEEANLSELRSGASQERKRVRKSITVMAEEDESDGEVEYFSAPSTPLREGREPKRQKIESTSREDNADNVEEMIRAGFPTRTDRELTMIASDTELSVETEENIKPSSTIIIPATEGFIDPEQTVKIMPAKSFSDLRGSIVLQILDLLYEQDNETLVSSICFGLTCKRHWSYFQVRWCGPSSNMIYEGYLPREDQAVLAPLLQNWVPDKYRMASGMGGKGGASFVPMFLSKKEYGEGYTREEERLEKRYMDWVSILDATNRDGLALKPSRGLHAIVDNTIDLPSPYEMGHSWYDAAASEYLFLVQTWEYTTSNGEGPGFEAICESWHTFRTTSLWDWVNGKGFNQFQEDWMDDQGMKDRKATKEALLNFDKKVTLFQREINVSEEASIVGGVED